MARAEAGNCMAVAISVDSPGNTVVPPHSLYRIKVSGIFLIPLFSLLIFSPIGRSFADSTIFPFLLPLFPSNERFTLESRRGIRAVYFDNEYSKLMFRPLRRKEEEFLS